MLRKPLFWIAVIIIVVVAYVGYGRWYGRVGSPYTGKCGDGRVTFGELCDDRNTVSGDGCNETCKTEPGFTCAGMPSVCSKVATRCGDGAITPGEVCDDANDVAGDGCSSDCQLEPGYICRGVPSVCEAV